MQESYTLDFRHLLINRGIEFIGKLRNRDAFVARARSLIIGRAFVHGLAFFRDAKIYLCARFCYDYSIGFVTGVLMDGTKRSHAKTHREMKFCNSYFNFPLISWSIVQLVTSSDQFRTTLQSRNDNFAQFSQTSK